MGGLTNPRPGAEDAEPVFLIPVGLPCLERGRLYKKNLSFSFSAMNWDIFLADRLLAVEFGSPSVR